MKEGDEVLIVEGQTIRLLGRVAGKIVSADLSNELWANRWVLAFAKATARFVLNPWFMAKRMEGAGRTQVPGWYRVGTRIPGRMSRDAGEEQGRRKAGGSEGRKAGGSEDRKAGGRSQTF